MQQSNPRRGQPRLLTPCSIEPFPYALAAEDVRLYLSSFPSDESIIAHFQLGSGLVESVIKWRFKGQFPGVVLAVRDSDTVTASILANGRQYRLPRLYAMYTFFFYSLGHERIADPCTRGQWIEAASELWPIFKTMYERKEEWIKETGRSND